MRPHKSLIERYLMKIEISNNHFFKNTPCWEFIGKGGQRYGLMIVDRVMTGMHRVIYEYYHGEIDPRLVIDHLCKNKRCSNILHLEQVTYEENGWRAFNS